MLVNEATILTLAPFPPCSRRLVLLILNRTTTAVIVIFAKLSDVFGRKLVLVGCIVGFTIFSGGCAAAQTIEQL